MPKGQISVEAIAAAAILTITLVAVMYQANIWDQQTTFIETISQESKECTRLQSAISMIQASGENAQIEMDIFFDVNIVNGYINLENYYCEIEGTLSGELTKGTVILKKEDGVVTIANT